MSEYGGKAENSDGRLVSNCLFIDGKNSDTPPRSLQFCWPAWRSPAPAAQEPIASRRRAGLSCLSKNGIGWRSPHLRFGGAMTTRRQWRGNLSAMHAEKRQAVDQYPAQRFPIQHEIQKLEDELNAFNERIEELENEGHRSHA